MLCIHCPTIGHGVAFKQKKFRYATTTDETGIQQAMAESKAHAELRNSAVCKRPSTFMKV